MGQRLENAKALYLEAIRDGNAAEAIAKYSGDRYTQHSTPVRDGPEGFIEFFEDFHRRNPVRDIEILRGFEDGNYVFLHVLQTLNNGEYQYVTADIFDTDENAKLIEHWDIIEEVATDRIGPHSQFDGPTEPTDLHRTEQNKDLVLRFVESFGRPDFLDTLDQFVSSDCYVQHNPAVADGIDGIRGLVADMAADGESLQPTTVHRVVGCGSFVAALGQTLIGAANSAVMYLFRVQDDHLVEFWGVTELITPEDTWVNSGKF